MKKIIQFTFMFLLVIQFFTLPPFTNTASAFDDVENGNWAKEAIELLTQKDLINGYDNNTFKPTASISRAEAVSILVRMLKLKPAKTTDSPFKDVFISHWANGNILIGYENQLLSGYEDRMFKPEASITRAETAALLSKAFKLNDKTPEKTFQDVNKNHWAYGAINKMAANQLVTGSKGNLFEPERAITRAEFTVVVARGITSRIPSAIDSSTGSETAKGVAVDAVPLDGTIYNLELSKWGIYNDGTHPSETTRGINDALKWAQVNGKTKFKVPAGTYLIAKGEVGKDGNNAIEMVSNMSFEMDQHTVFQKETNALEGYTIINVGPAVKNVTVVGGTLLGDRDTHDYSRKEGVESAGTHEWGSGITITGQNVVIDGLKIHKMTGDGIITTGATITGSTLTKFEFGSLNDEGNPIDESGKIRTVGRTQTNFDNKAYLLYRTFDMWLPKGLKGNYYDICFYRKDNSFIKCENNQKIYSDAITIPDQADYYRAVFEASDLTGVEVQQMTLANATNITIQNNDIGYNRRQGITAGGEFIQILNNQIHHTSGTAPQAGIDIEPGFMPAKHFLIKGNEFYNNKIQMVLAYGSDATIDGNVFKQENVSGGVGFYVHPAFNGTTVINNTFNGSGLTLQNDNAIADGNSFLNASASFGGMNSKFTNSTITDGNFSMGNNTGQLASNITVINTKQTALNLWMGEKQASLQDITLTNVGLDGYGHDENVFNNLVIKGRGSGFARGTYNNCTIEGGGSVNRAGKYTFNQCSFTSEHDLFSINSTYGAPTVTIKDSTFVLTSTIGYGAAFYVQGVQNLTLLNNNFTANHLVDKNTPLLKFGPYGQPQATKVLGLTMKGNTIDTNLDVPGIDTSNAGTDAPPYILENNTLISAKLLLKANDVSINNQLQTK